MCDWTDCPRLAMMENTPTINMTHTQSQPSCSNHSSTLHHERQCQRFNTFINDDELTVLSKGVVPAVLTRVLDGLWLIYLLERKQETRDILPIQFLRTFLHPLTQLSSVLISPDLCWRLKKRLENATHLKYCTSFSVVFLGT